MPLGRFLAGCALPFHKKDGSGYAIACRSLLLPSGWHSTCLKIYSIDFATEVEAFGKFPSLYMGLVGKNGEWDHYGGHLRFTDSEGNIVADGLSEDDYQDFLGEAV